MVEWHEPNPSGGGKGSRVDFDPSSRYHTDSGPVHFQCCSVQGPAGRPTAVLQWKPQCAKQGADFSSRLSSSSSGPDIDPPPKERCPCEHARIQAAALLVSRQISPSSARRVDFARLFPVSGEQSQVSSLPARARSVFAAPR
jgi:hypothetical protein